MAALSPGRYRGPSAGARRGIMAGIAVVVALLSCLALIAFNGSAERGPAAGGGALATFDVQAVPDLAGRRQARGKPDGRPLPRTASGDAPSDAKGRPDALDAETGSQTLAQAAGEVLADNPGAEDLLDYRRRLLEHIRRFVRYPPEALDTRAFGTVTVRFRLRREGGVIDLRILSTRGAVLDAAAMEAIWKAEPMPAVPITIPAPWEVDVPVVFPRPSRVPG